MKTETVKHTPGPWKVCYPVASEGCLKGTINVRFSGNDHSWHVASVYGNDGDGSRLHGSAKANANLIAAAPDLLHLAECVMREYDGCTCRERGGKSGYDCLWCKARKAVAKAEGRE